MIEYDFARLIVEINCCLSHGDRLVFMDLDVMLRGDIEFFSSKIAVCVYQRQLGVQA